SVYKNFGFKGLIASHNGALINCPENSFDERKLTIPKEIAFRILSDEKVLAFKEKFTIHNSEELLYQKSKEKLLSKHPEYINKIVEYFDGYKLEKSPISIFIKVAKSSENKINKIMEYLKNEYGTLVHISYWNSSSGIKIEIVNLLANKGEALKIISKHYGIHIKDTIAFGDSNNDFELLKMAGVGVAMKNAISDLKESADEITEFDCDNGGVWKHIIDNKLL
ncbi:MAG: HAD-IIB family hydrolase, partial [Mycoplasmataceae bacterium]|nr:HAD-IIB family hydrolase [Mycoplasmataceae bacterium]